MGFSSQIEMLASPVPLGMEPQRPPAEAEPQLKRQRSREGRVLLARALSGDSGGDGDEYAGESKEGGGIGGGGSGDSGLGSGGGSGSGSGGSGAVPRKCIPAEASFPVSLEAMRWAMERVAAGRFRGGKALHNAIYACHFALAVDGRAGEAHTRRIERIEALLQAGADVNFTDSHAVYVTFGSYDSPPCVLRTDAIAQGANDIYADDECDSEWPQRGVSGLTPLHVAAMITHPDNWMINEEDRGPEVASYTRALEGDTARNDIGGLGGWLVRRLAQTPGVEMHARSDSPIGWTPLHCAVYASSAAAVRSLLACGANPLVKCVQYGRVAKDVSARASYYCGYTDSECRDILKRHVGGLIQGGTYAAELTRAEDLCGGPSAYSMV